MHQLSLRAVQIDGILGRIYRSSEREAKVILAQILPKISGGIYPPNQLVGMHGGRSDIYLYTRHLNHDWTGTCAALRRKT